MRSLYEITREYLETLDNLQIDEETGEILDLDKLDAIAVAEEISGEAPKVHEQEVSSRE